MFEISSIIHSDSRNNKQEIADSPRKQKKSKIRTENLEKIICETWRYGNETNPKMDRFKRTNRNENLGILFTVYPIRSWDPFRIRLSTSLCWIEGKKKKKKKNLTYRVFKFSSIIQSDSRNNKQEIADSPRKQKKIKMRAENLEKIKGVKRGTYYLWKRGWCRKAHPGWERWGGYCRYR